MVGSDIMRKKSTTIQLPEELLNQLNEYKKSTDISRNIVIERCIRAFFEGRIIDIPEDLMEKLAAIQLEFGSPYSFIIERALRLFLAEEEVGIFLKERNSTGQV